MLFYLCRRADLLHGQPIVVSPRASLRPISTLRTLPPSDGCRTTTTETSWSKRAASAAFGLKDCGSEPTGSSFLKTLHGPLDSLHTPCLSKPEPVRRCDPDENSEQLPSVEFQELLPTAPVDVSWWSVSHQTCATVFLTNIHVFIFLTLIAAGCRRLWRPEVARHSNPQCSRSFDDKEDLN